MPSALGAYSEAIERAASCATGTFFDIVFPLVSARSNIEDSVDFKQLRSALVQLFGKHATAVSLAEHNRLRDDLAFTRLVAQASDGADQGHYHDRILESEDEDEDDEEDELSCDTPPPLDPAESEASSDGSAEVDA